MYYSTIIWKLKCARTSIGTIAWFKAKKGLLEIEERGPLRCTAARIMFAFSVFGNCNSMCKYGVSNDRAFVDACVRAYVSITSVSPAWTASIGPDRFSRSSLYLSCIMHEA